MSQTTKTTYNRDLDEYRVRLFVDGVYQAGADYFTSCKVDAAETARAMEKEKINVDAVPDQETQAIRDSEQLDYNCLYDVCNDYSLQVAEQEPDFKQYRKVKKENGFLFFHKVYEELHYFSGRPGLSGQNIDFI